MVVFLLIKILTNWIGPRRARERFERECVRNRWSLFRPCLLLRRLQLKENNIFVQWIVFGTKKNKLFLKSVFFGFCFVILKLRSGCLNQWQVGSLPRLTNLCEYNVKFCAAKSENFCVCVHKPVLSIFILNCENTSLNILPSKVSSFSSEKKFIWNYQVSK